MKTYTDKPSIETAHISLHGNRRDNQDRYAVIESQGVFLLILADGLGGHPKGDVAAEMLIHAAELFFPSQFDIEQSTRQFFQLIINYAHRKITAFGEAQIPAIKPRTTAVLALVDNKHIHWGHIGDSRLYLFRNHQVLYQTQDHTYAQELKRRGLNPHLKEIGHRNINALVRCVGGGSSPPLIEMGAKTSLFVLDVIILCSDGFWGQIDTQKIANAFDTNVALPVILSNLGQQALEHAFPHSDNVTAVALKKWRNVTDAAPVQFNHKTQTDDLNQAIDSLEDFIKKVEQDIKHEP